VAFEDESLPVNVDAVGPRAVVGADDDGLNAFDFPLSVE
jgi:hypothetical protein